MQSTELYGIVGNPLGHSLSPYLHNWAFSVLQHAGIFNAWPIEATQLQSFISAMRTLRICGCCVTIPYKESIIEFLDQISPRAKSIGAVNTLYWQGDMLCGENTDVDGFKLPLLKRAKPKMALVLGTGGAARAVLMGLKELGVAEIYVSGRSEQKTLSLTHDFDVQAVAWAERENLDAEWVINTTPLGMQGEYQEQSPYNFGPKSQDYLAYDLVYNPLKTRFLHEAGLAGYSTQDGLDMFVGQALSQMQLWMGKCVDAHAAREILLKYQK